MNMLLYGFQRCIYATIYKVDFFYVDVDVGFVFVFVHDNLPLDLPLIKMFSSCDPMSYLCGGNFV